MKRILGPLREMGASVRGTQVEGEERAPLEFSPGVRLKGHRHTLAVSSAQVKSCLILAGLFADGETAVKAPEPSRDHTERMLRAYGAPLRVGDDGWISISPPSKDLVAPSSLLVPGDPSSAAFLIGAGLLVPAGTVEVQSVDVNETRTGFLRVLARMGARVEVLGQGEQAGDPVAHLRVSGGQALRATNIDSGEIPSLVDEIPLLSIIASQAEGTTIIRGAQELRVKESDRIAQMVKGLRALGVNAEELPDGMIIQGPAALRGATIDAASDHRIAMSFTLAGLCASGVTEIDGAEWADISFPGFFALLGKMSGGVVQ
jgi:3-phosphoshikimate 1-carboxyvinyltransferase